MTDILKEADELINGERAQAYGDVTENFERISQLWSAFKGFDYFFSAYDVAYMMILVKMSRIATGGYHRDSLVDIAGYAALAEKVKDESDHDNAEAQALWEEQVRKAHEPKPRVWGSLVEIPTDVQVADRTGAAWLYKLGRWGWLDIDDDLDSWIDIELPDMWDSEGPFTEIIGDDVA